MNFVSGRLGYASVLLFAATLQLCGQAAPEVPCPSLDTISVVPHDPAVNWGLRFMMEPGRLEEPGPPLDVLLRYAYSLSHYVPLQGAPPWLATSCWDIVATTTSSADRTCLRPLLRSILEQRFKLQVHWQEGAIRGYALTVAPGGLRLHPPSLECGDSGCSMSNPIPPGAKDATYRIIRKSFSMDELRELLEGQFLEVPGTPIVDQTGVKGLFDLDLSYLVTSLSAAANAEERDQIWHANSLAMQKALEEQLGLRLDYHLRDLPDKVLVIDHIEQPAPN